MFMIFDHALFSAGPLYDKHPSHGWTQIVERYEWSADNAAELEKGWIRRADSIPALAALLLLPSLFYPFARDQGVFAYAGQVILRGGWPYRDVWDLKPPGVYFSYAAMLALTPRV